MKSSNYSIIVAEDESLLLENLIQKINATDLGFSVIGKAQTGADAYELIKELNPDLLVTDIRMPVLSGIELIEKVYNHYPQTKCIIISGFSDFEYARQAIHFQVLDYLLKPIDPEELYRALQSVKNHFEIQQQEFADIFNIEASRNTPEQIAHILKDYLIQNFSKDINLNLIANYMNYSPSYLTKIFQQEFDITPSKYLTSLRIAQARRHLTCSPEFTIAQIGEMVGYPDQSYFSRIFKKQTGISPLDYRGNDLAKK